MFISKLDTGIGGSKDEYLKVCKTISRSIKPLYTLQLNLMRVLLTNTDGDRASPSSRKIFIHKLRRYVIDSSLEQKVS